MLKHHLSARNLSISQRALLESQIEDIKQWLEPPVFDRPRHDDRLL